MTISTCFGECTTDATSCSEAVLYDVTFQVDMTPYTDAFTTAFVSGSFNGWSGGGNPMTDMGDGIWEATIPLSAGPIEYKIQLDEWMNQEQFTEGDECTVTSDGVNTNRSLDVSADVTVCYVWNTCTSCLVNVNNITTDNSIFTAVPTLVQNSTVVTFGDNFTAEKDLTVVNMLGQKVATANLATGVRTYTLTLDNLENGLYFINVETEGKQQTQRIVVNR